MASAGKLVASRKRENHTISDDKRENLTDVPLGKIMYLINALYCQRPVFSLRVRRVLNTKGRLVSIPSRLLLPA